MRLGANRLGSNPSVTDLLSSCEESVYLSVSLPTVLLGFSFMGFDLFATFDFYLFGAGPFFPSVSVKLSTMCLWIFVRDFRHYRKSNLAGTKLISFIGREMIPNICLHPRLEF